MKFYNLKTKKSVVIPDSKVTYSTKTTSKGRVITFAKAKTPSGDKLCKIVGNKAGGKKSKSKSMKSRSPRRRRSRSRSKSPKRRR